MKIKPFGLNTIFFQHVIRINNKNMKIALIDNERMEAQPKLQGLCPCCLQPVIAKCGKIKVWHWAHRVNTVCDRWWEPETEWHRAWKNNFPIEWQEISLIDEKTGEKHIADVRTAHNLVIEFQHSHIDPEERTSREQFYKNMVWIVDGTRLQRDYPRFIKGFKNFKTNQQGVFFVDFPDEVFPKNWLNSSVPVIFDFCGLSALEQDEIKNTLWCLLPENDATRAVVVGLRKSDFIQITRNRAHLFTIEKPRVQQPQRQSNLPSRGYNQSTGPRIDDIFKSQFTKNTTPRKRRW